MSFPLNFPFAFGDPADGDGTTTANSNTSAVRRLAMYLKGKENVEAFLTAIKEEVDEVTTAFEQLLEDRQLDNAFGEQLDLIGRILGQTREGYTLDDDYRKLLKARVKINKSSGTAEDLYAIFALILPTGSTMRIDEYEIAAFILTVSGALTDDSATFFARIMREAKAAGVQAQLTYAARTTNLFQYDSGQGYDASGGHYAGTVE